MNQQLPEYAALEQSKNELKAKVECLINISKTTIEQQLDNLKVSVFQLIDNFYSNSAQGQRISYESSPESVQFVPSDTTDIDVPLNLSNKCKEEEVEKPMDLCSFRISGQGQTPQKTKPSATHLAVQQTDPSNSSVVKTIQLSVPSSHMVSQPKITSPPNSVQQTNSLVRPFKIIKKFLIN